MVKLRQESRKRAETCAKSQSRISRFAVAFIDLYEWTEKESHRIVQIAS